MVRLKHINMRITNRGRRFQEFKVKYTDDYSVSQFLSTMPVIRDGKGGEEHRAYREFRI